MGDNEEGSSNKKQKMDEPARSEIFGLLPPVDTDSIKDRKL
jgi:hypothetical protein